MIKVNPKHKKIFFKTSELRKKFIFLPHIAN